MCTAFSFSFQAAVVHEWPCWPIFMARWYHNKSISSVMSVCHEFGTLVSESINITATVRIQLTKDKGTNKG